MSTALVHPDRRQVLIWLGATTTAPLLGCVGKSDGDTADTADTADSATVCEPVADETAGPFPGDGSNGPNALTLDDVVRSDIRDSIGTSTGTAVGVLLTLRMRIVDGACLPIVGAAVYVWLCDRDGEYSMYTLETENYLRGVQVTDDDGWVTFTSVFPGCYPGRWPHIHFEVYPDVAAITDATNAVCISQLAFDQATCEQVYAAAGYETSATNLAPLSIDTDNVFRDGWTTQLASSTGSTTDGFTSTLTVGIRG